MPTHENEFTSPIPWTVVREDNGALGIFTENGSPVVAPDRQRLRRGAAPRLSEADARFIAAAPEVIRALRRDLIEEQ